MTKAMLIDTIGGKPMNRVKKSAHNMAMPKNIINKIA